MILTPADVELLAARVVKTVHAQIHWTPDTWPDELPEDVQDALSALGRVADTWDPPHRVREKPKLPNGKVPDDCDGFAGVAAHDILLLCSGDLVPVRNCMAEHERLAAQAKTHVPDLAAWMVVGLVPVWDAATRRWERRGHAWTAVRAFGEEQHFDACWNEGPRPLGAYVRAGRVPIFRREYSLTDSLGPEEPY